jgi:hypothetical protein
MKSVIRHIVAELGQHDVLTHTLPYDARLVSRRAARQS